MLWITKPASYLGKLCVSALAFRKWGRTCLMALLILTASGRTSMADCSYVGSWSGQWNSYDGESGPLNYTVACDGHASGCMTWVIPIPDLGNCTLEFCFDEYFSGPTANFCFRDTDYCFGVPVTIDICTEGDCDGCDRLSGTYSGTSSVDGETFEEHGTWTVTRTSLPEKTFNSSPINGVANQSITVDLSWSNCGACTFDVYFGMCGSMVKVSDGQNETTYDPGTLLHDANYCWRIDARNSNGTTTGDVWSFTTEVGPGPIDIGLRVFDGTQIVRIACEPEGTLTSPLRIAKNGVVCGIVLVDPSDPEACNIRIQTSSGVKALRKL